VAVEPAAVKGPVVADLAHLVAELVENATQFSPPEARVTITGTPLLHGYRLRIADRGVGMTEAQLDEANDRLRPGTSRPVSTRLIGLDVVGRLAARHGISVVLAGGGAQGVVATVAVPAAALVPVSDLPAPRRPVSALVAAAAFRPPSGEARPAAPPTRAAEKKPAPAVAFVRPGVPRRVPGAQLPDLGPERDDDPRVAPDAGRVRVRLDALRGGLSAARTNNIPPLPRPLPDAPADGDG
jgi:histidine kinase/DNA gyrase B/HSP90-like ATPase